MNKILLMCIAVFALSGILIPSTFNDANASKSRIILSNVCDITTAKFVAVQINVKTNPLPTSTYPFAVIYCTDAEQMNKGSTQEKAEMLSFDGDIVEIFYAITIFRGNYDSTNCYGTIDGSEKITVETCTDLHGNSGTMRLVIP